MSEHTDSGHGSVQQQAPLSAWLRFAGIILVLTGAVNAIEGLVGLFDSDFYLVHPDDILLFGVTGLSWIQSVIGALVVITGVALYRGATWARPATIALTTVNTLGQLVFIAVYPIWSLIVITLCVIVIWAVIVHGDDAERQPRWT